MNDTRKKAPLYQVCLRGPHEINSMLTQMSEDGIEVTGVYPCNNDTYLIVYRGEQGTYEY